MTPLLIALSIAGGLAVIAFVISLFLTTTHGRLAKRLRGAAFVLAMICAALGVIVAFTNGG